MRVDIPSPTSLPRLRTPNPLPPLGVGCNSDPPTSQPQNGGPTDSDKTRLAAALPGIAPRILPDLHVGAGGAVQEAEGLFNGDAAFPLGAINAETNAGTHDMKRALDEAADLITWFSYDTKVTDRIYARTASFCSGSSNNFDQWDQGISFFLPNMTWYQPPGYVHVMITKTWAEQTLQATFAPGNATFPFTAQRTADGKSLVLRAVNPLGGEQPFAVTLAGGALAAGPTYTLWTLSGDEDDADNTPSNPTKISPQQAQVPIAAGAASISATLPARTFAVMVITLQ